MEEKNKRALKFIFGGILFFIIWIVLEDVFEDYIKSLLSSNKIIILIIAAPIGIYLFNKIEYLIDKTYTKSSFTKQIIKDQKDYGEKKWYHGKCYNCKNNSLTALVEEDVPIGKKLTCTECGSIKKENNSSEYIYYSIINLWDL